MKNQYFGDINDYRKYGLLRALGGGTHLRLLVGWMLTQDDGSADGEFRSYLDNPGRWMQFDSLLYDELRAMRDDGAERSVSLIERTRLLGDAEYYSGAVPDSALDRERWRAKLLEAARGRDLVFLDPDNGIEVLSKPVGRKGSSKYVAWKDVEALWNAGCSLLIYQHFPREARAAFVQRMLRDLKQRTRAPLVVGFRTSHVLFLLAAQQEHAPGLRSALASGLPVWEGEILVARLDGETDEG